jgi:CDP-6-deoxy-D-xylo-4-hexulose-3-dehydrase
LNILWFAIPLSTKGDRGELVAHLEKAGLETRSMMSGNILRHPAYKGLKVRKTSLKKADWILKHSFWITCHPRLTQEAREYIVKTFDEYYAS